MDASTPSALGLVNDPGWPWPETSLPKHLDDAVQWFADVVGWNRFSKMPDTSWRIAGHYDVIPSATRTRLALLSDALLAPRGWLRRKPGPVTVGFRWMLHTALISAALEQASGAPLPSVEAAVPAPIVAITDVLGVEAGHLFLLSSTVETLGLIRLAAERVSRE